MGHTHGMRQLSVLFQWGRFESAAGLTLDWKIDCDELNSSDWYCIANVMAPRLRPFSRVIGVPRGGLEFAAALKPHCKPGRGVVLLADDVWTTGKSMTEFARALDGQEWIGVVAFARGDLPGHVLGFAEISRT